MTMIEEALHQFLVSLSEFSVDSEIKSGAFAKVLKVVETATGHVYAAKDINSKGKKLADDVMIKRELAVLSRIKHNAVLPFRGVSLSNWEGEKYPTIFTRYMPNGSLGDLLRQEKLGKAPQEWTVTKKMICLYGICTGIAYLHKHNVIHSDLKPDNVLLDENYRPFISDFGMSNIISPTSKEKTMCGGTPVFMAPEIYINAPSDHKVDVYAFGMMLYQMFSLKEPFCEFKRNLFMIWHKILSGARPPFTDAFPDSYKALITKCWDRDPNVRPTMEEIVEKMEKGELMLDGVDQDEFSQYKLFVNQL